MDAPFLLESFADQRVLCLPFAVLPFTKAENLALLHRCKNGQLAGRWQRPCQGCERCGNLSGCHRAQRACRSGLLSKPFVEIRGL